jgi:peptidoglycan/xylan/chitin deacetylase (PgdA/CDA1 family)
MTPDSELIRKRGGMLTIIMYHYVRDLPRTRYPRIKGLLTRNFEGQLDYVTKHYTVCSLKQVLSAVRGEGELPPRPCLLTFDDGLLDHFVTVFPRLVKRGFVGSFYPVARAIEERRVPEVHKIQFILASTEAHEEIVKDIFTLLRQSRDEYDIPADADLYKTYAGTVRYDSPHVGFIKRVLQRGLPEEVRRSIIEALFARYVECDEETLASELFMDLPQLQCMVRHGMEIGGHGYSHRPLDTLSREEQEQEIGRTINFLEKLYGHRPSEWAMCYPYGSYNDATLECLAKAGGVLGLTTRLGLVTDLSRLLELHRVDTNDLSCSGSAEICEWTRSVWA